MCKGYLSPVMEQTQFNSKLFVYNKLVLKVLLENRNQILTVSFVQQVNVKVGNLTVELLKTKEIKVSFSF